MNFFYLSCLLIVLYVQNANCAMSEAQIKSSGRLIRNVCQPKTKVTNEQVDNTHKGTWEESKKLGCYYQCCLQMLKVMKDADFLIDSALAQIPQLPEARREPTKSTLTKCQNAGTGAADKCAAGYKIAQCIYNDNPQNYFLP